MSRIGKLQIAIPAGVEVKRDEKSNIVTVKGPKGELQQYVDERITFEIEDGHLHVKRPTDSKRDRSMHGLYRALLNNMIVGVSQGFTKKMEVIGVGYKAEAKGDHQLDMGLGYSHNILFDFPKEITVQTINEKGKSPIIILNCIDKQLLGQVATKIRSYRKPEPYKGKGIRFEGEYVRKKAGKSAEK